MSLRVPGLESLRPLYRRLGGRPDPLVLYAQLYGRDSWGFLYESLEERGGRGRFSFLGGRPLAVLRVKGERIRMDPEGGGRVEETGQPLDALREFVASSAEALPVASFPGGAVGYLGYDVARSLAPIPNHAPDDLRLADACFLIPREVIVVDHLDEVVHLLLYERRDVAGRLGALAAAVRAPSAPFLRSGARPRRARPLELRANVGRTAFAAAVHRARAHILDGDVYQLVLSRRFAFPAPPRPLDVYAALRDTNPSPYMYYLALDGLHLAGSSPEILVRLTGRRVVSRPLAGTRPRGRTPEEDERLERELLSDPKERAEHVMLLDLARNDVGRVSRAGSVAVEERFAVERYARVRHLVSQVTGRLREDRDAIDLLGACFPAGTVAGAPKIRAMQLIEELEPVRRGPYAGAIGYLSFLGDLDLCIAIRTVLLHGARGFLQVGAGIVADSTPEREYAETESKARAVLAAVAACTGSGPPAGGTGGAARATPVEPCPA